MHFARRHPSRAHPHPPARVGGARGARWPGFTVIELAITLGIAAILVAMALPAIDFNRFRMDANARLVQNTLVWAQTRAIQRNVNVLVQFDTASALFRIVDDANGDGTFTTGETVTTRRLAESMRFRIPPSTIDGAAAAVATGAGITSGTYLTLTFYPNGSSSGAAVIYIGSPRGRTQDNRAIKVTAATSKMSFYRMAASGTWSLSEL